MLKTINLLFWLYLFTFSSCKSQSRIPADSLYPKPDLAIPFKLEKTSVQHYNNRIQYFKNNPLQLKDIVFLGNSITENGGDWGKRFNLSAIKNRGISGDNTDGVLNRLDEICYFKPSMVFMLIGINDVFNPYISVEYIFNNIIKIVNVIYEKSTATKIYVHTILPTSDFTLTNKIKELNKLLSNKPLNYTILDIHGLFLGPSDLIKKEYTTDGIHLSEAGYTVWVNYLKNYFNLK
jgi:lysophospholipase L1-like esterase